MRSLSHASQTELYVESRVMPTFEPSASCAGRAEARRLREVLGPGTPRATSLRIASRDSRRRQRRAMAMRALIVAVLAGSFFGSVALFSGDGSSPGPVAKRAVPVDADPVITGSIAKQRPPLRPVAQ
jgi:hypothetical protein